MSHPPSCTADKSVVVQCSECTPDSFFCQRLFLVFFDWRCYKKDGSLRKGKTVSTHFTDEQLKNFLQLTHPEEVPAEPNSQLSRFLLWSGDLFGSVAMNAAWQFLRTYRPGKTPEQVLREAIFLLAKAVAHENHLHFGDFRPSVKVAQTLDKRTRSFQRKLNRKNRNT